MRQIGRTELKVKLHNLSPRLREDDGGIYVYERIRVNGCYYNPASPARRQSGELYCVKDYNREPIIDAMQKSRLSPLRGTEQLGVAEERISGYTPSVNKEAHNQYNFSVGDTTALLRRMQSDIAWETGLPGIHRCTTTVWTIGDVSTGSRYNYPTNWGINKK